MLANLDNEVHFKKVFTATIKNRIKKEAIKRILNRGKVTIQEIAEDFEVGEDYVRQIEKEMR